MQTASLVKPFLTDDVPPRPVTRRMLDERTREIAVRAGRIPPHVTQADYEQAKRELTGFAEAERQDTVIEQA